MPDEILKNKMIVDISLHVTLGSFVIDPNWLLILLRIPLPHPVVGPRPLGPLDPPWDLRFSKPKIK